MSDVPWNDPKFGPTPNLSEEDRLKLERALQRQAEEAHRRAPGRSQADLHEYGTVSEGVEYGRPVPPTAREDWHAQQREQALAEQAGREQALAEQARERFLNSPSHQRHLVGGPAPASDVFGRREDWHEQQRQQHANTDAARTPSEIAVDDQAVSEQEALRRMGRR